MTTLGRCGFVDGSVACKGKLERKTTHVGECAACGRIWWIQRRLGGFKGGRFPLPEQGTAYRVAVELIRELERTRRDARKAYDLAGERMREILAMKRYLHAARRATTEGQTK